MGGGGRALPRRAACARAGRRGRRPPALRAAARARRVAGARRRAREPRDVRGGRRRGALARRPGAARPCRARLRRPLVAARARRGGRRGACCRRCSAALGDEDSPLRARLLARLALELYYADDPDRRLTLSAEAVALARRLGDPMALATCLDARHYALWRPETVHERLAVASELRRLAETVGDPELELEGAGWTVVDLLELGDVAGADDPDRRRVAAGLGAAPAAVRVVDVAVPLRAGADRRRLRRGRAARAPDARDRAARAGGERACTSSPRRCSTSAASRGASARSRTPCAASSRSTRRCPRGAARSPCCTSSWAARTRRGRSTARSRRRASTRSHATPSG